MPSTEFETVISASKRLQAYALDRPATWIGPTPDIQHVQIVTNCEQSVALYRKLILLR